ncbi:G1/S-specific cyclin-D2-like [Oncorhynchus keta]|uniref:G1/S-specific cyclin-D2-like n=1 Tax=Oncorhynchus keta TaxID=8018 RepID=UPI00227B4116|nr:G1/S-specific cyclin-D2-like [Oncorhynchus keta]
MPGTPFHIDGPCVSVPRWDFTAGWPGPSNTDCYGFAGSRSVRQWELVVVAGLKWDLASVLPSDFPEPILHGIPIIPHNLHALRRHVHSYIALAATEYKFSVFLPSTIAYASVGTAIHRLKLLDGALSNDSLMQLLENILAFDLESLCCCSDQLEGVLELSLPPSPRHQGLVVQGCPSQRSARSPLTSKTYWDRDDTKQTITLMGLS